MENAVVPTPYNELIRDVSIVKPKHGLIKDIKQAKITQFIIDELKLIPDWSKYRIDNEFIKMACNLIENLVVKKDKIDKKEIILIVFQKLFNLTAQEIKIVSDVIEFLVNNKKIKKIKIYKKVYIFLKKFFLNRLG
jgi:hypothetical protein